MLADLDFNEKEALIYLHISPSEYEKEDYFNMNRVLAAKSPEERPVDPMSLVRSLGLGNGETKQGRR
ncbi:hypothetical protein IV38_GL001962 [Lactobacillus selangorensis]|uniref:Uncharacterized protein n=1 Tax=Lactobacillus selangorensis TaxID=81857 RepID=A0A0R2FSU3_9LACO|nr:hypothetical protein [Lactobacillus selangorensis]KRN27748.1 hypothetical protein IV38_GL001962 [Lactobacillus selangorensis]KRN30287.1 hypothetical protein IV40_GL001875 [Lactobacillus selangorensis]